MDVVYVVYVCMYVMHDMLCCVLLLGVYACAVCMYVRDVGHIC